MTKKKKPKTFAVCITQSRVVYESATIEVPALTEEEACARASDIWQNDDNEIAFEEYDENPPELMDIEISGNPPPELQSQSHTHTHKPDCPACALAQATLLAPSSATVH